MRGNEGPRSFDELITIVGVGAAVKVAAQVVAHFSDREVSSSNPSETKAFFNIPFFLSLN